MRSCSIQNKGRDDITVEYNDEIIITENTSSLQPDIPVESRNAVPNSPPNNEPFHISSTHNMDTQAEVHDLPSPQDDNTRVLGNPFIIPPKVLN